MCTDKGDADPQKDDDQEQSGQKCIIPHSPDLRQQLLRCQYDSQNKGDGYQTADGPVNDGFYIHGPGDKTPGGPYHLHGLDEKAITEHRQAYGIIYQDDDREKKTNDHHQKEQTKQTKQKKQERNQGFVI